MREIVLDTETTGLDPENGHRIAEIGAIELMGHMPTKNIFHEYINPDRPMPKDAAEVHGLTDDFLRNKPKFEEIAEKFIDFIGDAKLVIHNAAFDMKFINAEFERMNITPLPMERAIDTLEIARRRFPGSPASLDSLCRRFGVDNSAREKHGALLDSEILADVYLELIGGKQPDFSLSGLDGSHNKNQDHHEWMAQGPRPRPLPSRLSDEERAAHAEFVKKLGEDSLWLRPEWTEKTSSPQIE